jgi:hypothetical protein
MTIILRQYAFASLDNDAHFMCDKNGELNIGLMGRGLFQ